MESAMHSEEYMKSNADWLVESRKQLDEAERLFHNADVERDGARERMLKARRQYRKAVKDMKRSMVPSLWRRLMWKLAE